MVTACAVRLRETPEVAGAETSRLALGDELQVLERTAPATLAGQTAPWFHVKLADGRAGWVFGGFTAEAPLIARETLVKQLLESRRAKKTSTASEWTEVIVFCDRQLSFFKGKPLEPELELMRLEAVVAYLEARVATLSEGTSHLPPSHPALKPFLQDLVYSEPSGLWLLRAQVIWDLHERYKALPIADRIAWVGSQASLPGETESYLPAITGAILLTDGKYLALHPRGAFAGKALASITDWLKGLLPGPDGVSFAEWDKEDVSGLQKDLRTLADAIRKTQAPESAEALKVVEALRRAVK